jgi:hypothetical protein
MRTYILVILSAMLLAGLFAVYWTIQPTRVSGSSQQAGVYPVPPPPKAEPLALRKGEGVSLIQYDRNGQMTSRFRGDEYTPQPDGTIHITRPVAEFFFANHQHMRIIGEDGNVVAKDVPRLAQQAFANPGPPAPPSRGRLNHVTITLFDDARPEPMLTMTTNNVAFDNDTYLVSTESYKDNNQSIDAEHVPVHVRGKIDMEGQGLTIRWDDKDGRLQLLEIKHGDWLKITDTSMISSDGPRKSKSLSARADGPLPEMLASTDPKAPSVVTHFPGPATKPHSDEGENSSRPARSAVVYQASFFDNVRINQPAADGPGDQVYISGVDRMDVDFLMKESSSTTQPSTQPAPASSAQPTEGNHAAPPTTVPASDPVGSTKSPDRGSVRDVSSVSTAQTQPAVPKEPPIYVRWTGVLRISPLTSELPPVALTQGDSAVFLTGAPVSIHRVEARQQGVEDIQAATVLYQKTGERVWLGKSERYPEIHVTKIPAATAKSQAPTRLVSSQSVRYSRGDGKAIMEGPGHADVPLDPVPKGPPPVLHAGWADKAEFSFSPAGRDSQPVISSARFDGDVDIHHPRFLLESQTVEMAFDPPTKPAAAPKTRGPADDAPPAENHSSQPNLRQVTSTGKVFCQLQAGNAKQQMITCNRLVLDTDRADGKLYARHINATGTVHAYGDDDLRAEYVDVLLNPSKKAAGVASHKPAADDENAPVELQQLIARQNVIAKSKDSSVATGDELRVVAEDGKQKTFLTSRTAATVTDPKGNIVRGPEIQFESADGRGRVVGPGSLHAAQQASATQPAQDVDVTWSSGTVFNGEGNSIDVNGDVVATSVDKRGYLDISKGDHMKIDLRPKPTTAPSASPADSQQARLASSKADAEAPANGVAGGMKMDPFKGKEVSVITIDGNASLTSTLLNSQNNVLQQFQLVGPTIIVRELAADGTANRSVTVPAAGKMLSRDHRPAAKEGDKTAAKDKTDDSSGNRGATAFQWAKQFTYSEATHRADMLGDVLIVHQDDAANAAPVRINGQHVIAWFESAPKATTAVAASHKPKSDGASQESPMRVRYLTVEGDAVTINRETDQVVARQVAFDPLRHLLICSGTERNPVLFNNGETGNGSAQEVVWDTLTWKMKAKEAIFDYRPLSPAAPAPAPDKKVPGKSIRP